MTKEKLMELGNAKALELLNDEIITQEEFDAAFTSAQGTVMGYTPSRKLGWELGTGSFKLHLLEVTESNAKKEMAIYADDAENEYIIMGSIVDELIKKGVLKSAGEHLAFMAPEISFKTKLNKVV